MNLEWVEREQCLANRRTLLSALAGQQSKRILPLENVFSGIAKLTGLGQDRPDDDPLKLPRVQ